MSPRDGRKDDFPSAPAHDCEQPSSRSRPPRWPMRTCTCDDRRRRHTILFLILPYHAEIALALTLPVSADSQAALLVVVFIVIANRSAFDGDRSQGRAVAGDATAKQPRMHSPSSRIHPSKSTSSSDC